jgi:pimeloyl-ACP methyl ester carboxylesterase
MFEVMTTDMRGEVGAITTPMTVLYAYDGAMGPQAQVDAFYQGAYAPAADARLVRIDGSLHFLMMDQKEAFHAAVTEFLRQ